MSERWPWLAVIALGAFHGLNPAMGWLFAVALGLQERSRRAVYRALLPIGIGHFLSVAVVVAAVAALQLVVEPRALRIAGAVALIGFGMFKLVKPRSHPKWVGMRVTLPELAWWSFIMSTAHGAGLMLVPVLVGLPGARAAQGHAMGSAGASSVSVGIAATLLHGGAMLLVMAAVAVLVYEKLGVAILRKAWLNLDVIWAGAVLVAGVVTLFT